ncbi:MAG: hypothetical protein APR63_09975 [Desulfuromonas sp. SDB]|nr:MAG: hypothetical protein APR63_09975 [Desulfuromonas sp. SDB]
MPESWDLWLMYFINRDWHSSFLNPLFIALSDKNLSLIPIVLVTVLLFWKGGKKGVLIFFGLIVSVALSDLISSRIFKDFFQRPRPCEVLPNLNFYRKEGNPFWVLTDGISSYKSSFSFLSSHASNSMSFAVLLGLFYKKLLPFLIVFSVFIGLSRIYLGFHYPSDVIAGFCLGAIIAFFVKALIDISIYSCKKIKLKKKNC